MKNKQIIFFSGVSGKNRADKLEIELDDPRVGEIIGSRRHEQLMEEVDRPNFLVHMDPINWITDPKKYFNSEAYVEHCMSLLGGKIRSCHVKDILLTPELTLHLKEMRCGEGTFPIARYLHLIEEIDPDMPVFVEHMHAHQEYLDSIAYLKELTARENIVLR